VEKARFTAKAHTAERLRAFVPGYFARSSSSTLN
jgi:hypothetical protein